ncbi:MAG: thioredoxin family protein [Nitrospirota bacterium]|nr:thioredoxin family protein [Nitrospirota bacterium]
MALLETTTIPMGTPCPDFHLPAVDGKSYGLSDFAPAEVLVVLFICNHCPYVVAIEERMIALARHFAAGAGGKPVQFVGICSNDPTDYPDDSFENLQRRWQTKNYGFPYLHDLSQQVARSFGAVCTPDIFVYDRSRALAYHGRFDDSWKDPKKVASQDLRAAIEALLTGAPLAVPQVPGMGCSIKWRAGQ